MGRFRGVLSAILVAVFGLAGYGGYTTPSHSTVAVEIGVWVSGFFWFLAALVPIWRQSDYASAYLNSIAAAAAVYAGIAALQ
jgi:hypothetical protein